MGFMVIAFLLGAVVGLARGGRLRHLGDHSLNALPLLVVGALCQALGQVINNFPLIIVSYLFLAAFVFWNINFSGMVLVYIGLILNFLVIAVNGGMPVRADALRSLGAQEREIATYDFKAKRHLEDPRDRLKILDDWIPVPFPGYEQVISIGDVVLTLGIAFVFAGMLQPGPGRPKRAAEKEEDYDGIVVVDEPPFFT